MIWLFKVNEVFWENKPIVIDITKYDISLYFPTANYYLINESDNSLVYLLRNNHSELVRVLIPKEEPIYEIIREFYINKQRDIKISSIIK